MSDISTKEYSNIEYQVYPGERSHLFLSCFQINFRKDWVSIKFLSAEFGLPPPPPEKGPEWGKTVLIILKSSKLTLFPRGGGGGRNFMDKTILWTSGRFWWLEELNLHQRRANREVQTVNWEGGREGAVERGVKSSLKKAHKPWIGGKKGAQTVNWGGAKPWSANREFGTFDLQNSSVAVHSLHFMVCAPLTTPFVFFWISKCRMPWIFWWIFSSNFSMEKGPKKSTKKSPAKFTRDFVRKNSPRISAEAFSWYFRHLLQETLQHDILGGIHYCNAMTGAVLPWKERIFRLQLQFFSPCYVEINYCNVTG